MATLRLLGGLSLEDERGPIAGRSAQRRRLALLALLATAPRPLSRDKLVTYLWPEADSERARHLLSESVYVIRKVVGEDALLAQGDELRLNAEAIHTDIEEFEAALARGDPAAAVELYAGPFLDGFFVDEAPEFERWADGERARYARTYLEALQRLAAAAAASGDRHGAVRWWRRLAERDPYSGAVALGLMQALEAVGDRAAAIRFARVHTTLLREELEAEPAPEVQAFLRRLREPAAAPSAAPAPPLTLATPLPLAVHAREAATHSESSPPVAIPEAVVALAPGDAAPPVAAAVSTATASPAAPAPSRPRRWRRLVMGAAALLIVLGLSTVPLWRMRSVRPPAGSLAARPAVLVLPFSVQGGPAVAELRDGMVDLLSTALDGAGDLHSVDPYAVLAYCRQRGGAVADPAEASAVAKHFGARFYLLGNVVEAGGRVSITAQLYDRERAGDPAIRAGSQGTVQQLFELVDSITARLLVGRLKEPGQRLSRVAALTTRSLPAWKAYLQGEDDVRLARYERAAAAYARAVTLDSSYALAYYRLSAASEWGFDFLRAHTAAGRALAYGARLSEPDWQLLRAWSSFLAGDAAQAQRQYEDLVANRPDDVEAWAGLGEVLVHYGAQRGQSVQDARPAFERALALGGDYGEVRFHLLELAAQRRDSAAFRELLAGVRPDDRQHLPWQAVGAYAWGDARARADATASLARADEMTLGIAIARVATAIRDFPAAGALARALTGPARPSAWRAGGYLTLAELALAGGRFRTARAELATARPLEPAWSLELEGLATALPFFTVTRTELLALRDSLRASRPERWAPNLTFFLGTHADAHVLLRSYLLGVVSTRLDDSAAAQEYLRELRGLGRAPDAVALRESLVRSLRAWIARREGRPADALALLSADEFHPALERIALSPFYSRALERYARAELLEEAGRHAEALRWYGTLAEGYDFVFAAPAHLQQARIYDRLGDPDRARAHYAEFVRLWQRADPELQPLVAEARSRLAGQGAADAAARLPRAGVVTASHVPQVQ